jgi:trehalose 6-phosphate phosphatase
VKDVLAPKNLSTLRAFAGRRVLLAFDFDGTLAPIVRNPKAAAMRPRTRRLLAQLADRYPCVVISGRARPDVRRRVDGVGLRAVYGNHGMETGRTDRAALARTAGWHAQLDAALPHIPGVIVESKGPSLAVHYRQAKERATARRIIVRAARRLDDVRIIEGKMVVNVMPTDAAHKGTALLALCARLRCQAAVYFGDDDNDEDVFTLDRSRVQLFGIRVGLSRRSRAEYYVRSQGMIDRVLAALLAAPPYSPASPGKVPAARRKLRSVTATS